MTLKIFMEIDQDLGAQAEKPFTISFAIIEYIA